MRRCCYRASAGAAAAHPSLSRNENSLAAQRRFSVSVPMHRALLLSFSRRGRASTINNRAKASASSFSSSSSSSASSSVQPPKPPPQPPLQPLPAALARARARARLSSLSPPLTLRVAGVSFEGRQEAASTLRKGQPLALRRERGNAFDPNAVRVETLDGCVPIGYVPRAETDAALPGDADAAFAVVRSVGRAHLKEEEEEEEAEKEKEEEEAEEEEEVDDGKQQHRPRRRRPSTQPPSGPWGVTISLRPGLRPLEIDALPPPVAAAGPLSSALPDPEWRRLAREAARASGFRCSVTGGVGGGGGGGDDESNPRSAPVEVHEHWRVDDDARVAVLLGLRALCPEAHDVAHGLSLQSQQARERAAATLRGVNGWGAEDAASYWRGREALAASRAGRDGEPPSSPPSSSRPWRIDAQWLEEQGVDLGTLSDGWRDLLLL